MKKNIKVLVITLFCITLVGCTKGTHSISNVNLESTKTKEVIKYSDNMTYVYYHDDKNVTGLEVYIEYNDHDTAQIMYENNQNAGNYENQSIEKVEVIDNYIVMKYNELGYKKVKTYEELKSLSKKYNK